MLAVAALVSDCELPEIFDALLILVNHFQQFCCHVCTPRVHCGMKNHTMKDMSRCYAA